MVAIYDSIADLLDVCIKHLRRSNKIDTSDFSLESCLFRSFDEIVRRQLDSVWHTITPQTKQVSGSHPGAQTDGFYMDRLGSCTS